ncbi:hypothetical protein [Achromobacter xylosoxidans]|uniref:Uncharacterized protein n=1 Tax=Alcaligenes xylosoxydans xylosoxydans TaxID=85698 RepID=A0A424W7L8_ALCXX|nr:hypothetical protein [Achromobacter xylosoxidans]MBC9907015.1 hypothetical protein [Achromobacter xylosoxidans]MBD0871682.1 hypothetical protein [Achromobacter xylosoxidans]QNP87589.1 hypothetical protein IAG39_08780 [Achromobacter xylosoxidans]RPJ89201.1 hypothetical protein DY367_24085 [Achromobacter xylosoxidans]
MSAIDETNKNKRHWVRIARHASLSENPRLRMDRDAKQKPDSDSAKHSALQKSTPYIPLISPAPKATAYRCPLNAERQRRAGDSGEQRRKEAGEDYSRQEMRRTAPHVIALPTQSPSDMGRATVS